jgi:hypothetical protein
MSVVCFVLGGFLLFSSGLRAHLIYLSIVDTFPPQFQDDLVSRYAFPVLVLSHPTPLSLQADYLKSALTGWVGSLCISAGFFFASNFLLGYFTLAGLAYGCHWLVNAWKTYRTNCERQMDQDQVEDT